MNKLVLIATLVASYFCSFSQTKLLTIEDAVVNNKTTLAPANLHQLQFIFGTEDYTYLSDQEVWVKGSFKTKKEAPFLTLDELNQHLIASGNDTVSKMPDIEFNKSRNWILTIKGNKIALNPLTNKSETIVTKPILAKSGVEVSAAGYVAYRDSFNLYVSNGTTTKQVTTDGSSNIVYDSTVHREEFGITKGGFWSNDGKLFAFYRMDQSMVTDYPIIDWTERPAKNVNIKYPMAGDSSHHVTVGVYNAETGSLVYLKTGEPAEQYLTNITWSPDDRFVFIAVLNRDQNDLRLNQYDASTGDFIKTVLEEKDEKYVEPLVPMLFVKNKPSQFIWQSNRDGWNHLYLYDFNGKLLKQLTKGEWEVLEVKGFDEKGENLFYTSTQQSPISKNLYELNLKSGKIKSITNSIAVHTDQISSSGKYVLDNVSDATHARLIQLIETASGKANILFEAKNPLEDFATGKMSVFTINNSNGTPLYCRLYKPVNFDSTKKYPVIVYWYGGPHVQMITAGFNGGASDYWFQYMAERGYVVFTLDVRGSDNRGKAFEQAIFRKAGEAQMEDMMAGVNYLNNLTYVDKNNMGLFGWSYGGFMTIDFMLTHPTIFKAAVAGGPVTDWSYYEVMYGERYMDTPQENPEGYAATDLIKQVAKLKGKLLLIHGLQDPVVVQQHSVRFVRAAIDKKVQVDYMIYPGHEHNVLGKDRAHLYTKVTDYFTQYLK